MPLIAHLFGVRPWELDLLSTAEFQALANAAEDYEREMQRT